MRKFSIFCSLILVSALSCEKLAAFPLYRVEKNGVTNWLLGTAHMPIEPSWVPPELIKQISNARIVLSEQGDSKSIASLQAQEQQWIRNRLKTGPYRHLNATLDLPTLTILREVMKFSGSDIDNLDYLPPAFLGEASLGQQFINYEERLIVNAWHSLKPKKRQELALKLKLKTQELDLLSGYIAEEPQWLPLDQTLTEIAEAKNKPILALDNFTILERAFVSIDETTALRAVRTFTRRIQLIKEALSSRILDFQFFHLLYSQPNGFLNYLRWNPNSRLSVEASAEKWGLPDYPVIPALLKRHSRWMSLMSREFAKGSALVIVGDSHLTGRADDPSIKSLIDLLRQRGYKVAFESPSICEDQLKSLSIRAL